MLGKKVKTIATAMLGACAAFALLGGSTAHGQVQVNDFVSQSSNGGYYGGTQGWFPYGAVAMGFADGIGGDPAPPTGAGSLSWAYMEPGQYYGHFTAQNWAFGNNQLGVGVWNANNLFSADLIFPSSGPNQWFAEGTIPLTLDIQFGGGVDGTVDQFDTINVNTNLQDTIIPIDIPYTPDFDPTATFANVTMEIDPGYNYGWDPGNPSSIPYAAYMYMSDVQLSQVPEPATLGILGAGLTMLMARRRRV
jgi:PEP-CTERM motif